MLEISSSLVSKKTDEGNEGSTALLTGDCAPGDPDLPGVAVNGGPDFSRDADPIKVRHLDFRYIDQIYKKQNSTRLPFLCTYLVFQNMGKLSKEGHIQEGILIKEMRYLDCLMLNG